MFTMKQCFILINAFLKGTEFFFIVTYLFLIRIRFYYMWEQIQCIKKLLRYFVQT